MCSPSQTTTILLVVAKHPVFPFHFICFAVFCRSRESEWSSLRRCAASHFSTTIFPVCVVCVYLINYLRIEIKIALRRVCLSAFKQQSAVYCVFFAPRASCSVSLTVCRALNFSCFKFKHWPLCVFVAGSLSMAGLVAKSFAQNNMNLLYFVRIPFAGLQQ